MSCRVAARRLSAYRDGELSPQESRELDAHLERCSGCARVWRSFSAALDSLANVPRLRPAESIAARVLSRLEVETRGPGLALLFRPTWAARPLILPSLFPAALVLVTVLGGALLLHGWTSYTLPEPYAPSASVSFPRTLSAEVLPPEALLDMEVGTLFVESVVARDGSVVAVTLLDGDSAHAGPLLDALRYERFEPARFRGRPVSVSVYRLISRMDVRAPVT